MPSRQRSNGKVRAKVAADGTIGAQRVSKKKGNQIAY
jgi:hypothetical protein